MAESSRNVENPVHPQVLNHQTLYQRLLLNHLTLDKTHRSHTKDCSKKRTPSAKHFNN